MGKVEERVTRGLGALQNVDILVEYWETFHQVEETCGVLYFLVHSLTKHLALWGEG